MGGHGRLPASACAWIIAHRSRILSRENPVVEYMSAARYLVGFECGNPILPVSGPPFMLTRRIDFNLASLNKPPWLM
jgi:hypothetical protein